MKKTLVALIVVLGMLAGTAAVASAAPPDNKLVFDVTCPFGEGQVTVQARNPNQQAVWGQQVNLVTGQTERGVGITFDLFDELDKGGRGKAPVSDRGFFDRVVVCTVDLEPVLGFPFVVPAGVKLTGQAAKNL